MRASQHSSNLTVSHLRRSLFGGGRFNGIAHRLRSIHRQIKPAHVHAADRARLAPPCDRCRAQPQLTDPVERKVWPFDTAFPSALPPVAIHPGQLLTDMPSTGAQRSKPSFSDLSTIQAPLTAPKPSTAGHLGKLIDVWA